MHVHETQVSLPEGCRSRRLALGRGARGGPRPRAGLALPCRTASRALDDVGVLLGVLVAGGAVRLGQLPVCVTPAKFGISGPRACTAAAARRLQQDAVDDAEDGTVGAD